MVKQKPSKTGHAGIYLLPSGRYRVRVKVGGRSVDGGTFHTLTEAIEARDALHVTQSAARIAKAKTNPVTRSAAPRPDLGTVRTPNGGTRKRERHPQFTVQRAAKMEDPTPPHIFEFSQFLALGMAAVAPHTCLYLLRTTPLAAKGVKTRGTVAEAVVRRVLERRGDVVRDREHDSHDLIRIVDGGKRRGEVKNGRMTRNANRWTVVASNVKPDRFDDLYLVFEGLDGMYVYEWGGQGLRGTEHAQKAKEGGTVAVVGDRHTLDPDDAHAALLVHVEAHGNTRLAFVPYDDPAFQDCVAISTKTEELFANIPLGTLQGPSRGDAAEAIVAAVLQRLGYHVTLPTAGQRSNGDSRGQRHAKCDRLVDGVPNEFKSALLSWVDGKRPRFWLHFDHVKAYQHSDRYLAWFTLKALHIWKQPQGNTAGFCGTGFSQVIKFDGPFGRNQITDPAEAEAYFLKKLAFKGLEYVARLDIGPGDFEIYEAAIEAKRAHLGAAEDEGDAGEAPARRAALPDWSESDREDGDE